MGGGDHQGAGDGDRSAGSRHEVVCDALGGCEAREGELKAFAGCETGLGGSEGLGAHTTRSICKHAAFMHTAR